jgi:predicted O-methyltransferase YrrM
VRHLYLGRRRDGLRMPQDQWKAVDGYIRSLFVPTDSALDAITRSITDAGLPPISVSPPQGKFLMMLARFGGAKKVLEIGTLGGYSTVWLARGLPRDGRLVTLEIDPEHARIARANLARAGVEGIVEVRLGPALESLPKMLAGGEGPFDLIFIDADKESYPEYLDWAVKLSRPGTLIVADNVVRNGRVVDEDSADPDVRGVRRFNDALSSNPRVTAVELQTVGSKGYDGFAMALVVG